VCHAREHLVEALPVGRAQFLLDLRRHPAAVVVVHLQAEGVRAPRHRLADPSHADNAEALAADAVAEHPGRRPAGPWLIAGQDVGALDQPPRHRQNQRHRHVGGVLGEHARRIGDGDAALERGRDVDVVDAVAKIGDQLELLAGLAQHRGVDAVGDGRHQHVGLFHRRGELGMAERGVIQVEFGVEQFAHARFDAVRQSARHHNQRLFPIRHRLALQRALVSLDLVCRLRRKSAAAAPATGEFSTRISACSGLLNPAHRHCFRPLRHG